MILAWRAVSCAEMSTRAMPPYCMVLVEISLLSNESVAPAAAGQLAATNV
jgi:hypothetical protein